MPAQSNAHEAVGSRRRRARFAGAAMLISAVLLASPVRAGDGAVMLGEYVTALTLARDGAWGTATETSTGRAIAHAIRDCKAMSRHALGCGAMFTTVRSGWSIAVLCGDETIVAAAARRADAEQMAREREYRLRHVYLRSMPPCRRVATVDPDGLIVKPPAGAVADRQ